MQRSCFCRITKIFYSVDSFSAHCELKFTQINCAEHTRTSQFYTKFYSTRTICGHRPRFTIMYSWVHQQKKSLACFKEGRFKRAVLVSQFFPPAPVLVKSFSTSRCRARRRGSTAQAPTTLSRSVLKCTLMRLVLRKDMTPSTNLSIHVVRSVSMPQYSGHLQKASFCCQPQRKDELFLTNIAQSVFRRQH